MKKMILLVAAVVAFATTSCNKEKTCVCTPKVTVNGITTTGASSETTTKNDCADGNSTTTANGMTSTVTCVEK